MFASCNSRYPFPSYSVQARSCGLIDGVPPLRSRVILSWHRLVIALLVRIVFAETDRFLSPDFPDGISSASQSFVVAVVPCDPRFSVVIKRCREYFRTGDCPSGGVQSSRRQPSSGQIVQRNLPASRITHHLEAITFSRAGRPSRRMIHADQRTFHRSHYAVPGVRPLDASSTTRFHSPRSSSMSWTTTSSLRYDVHLHRNRTAIETHRDMPQCDSTFDPPVTCTKQIL